ncbi:MAG: multidrug efflux MFS transporter, partial [Clostridia bacterium]|nr:multidrug efflux MFS transporter [Clostridia bacterium]
MGVGGTKRSTAWLAVGAVMVGAFICVLNNSLINVALTTLMGVFNVGTVEIQWVLASFLLTFGVIVPVSGYLADSLGTKKLYIYALMVFISGSVLGSFAWSLPTLIGARVVQALGAGMIMPTSLTIIYKVIPGHERGLAIGAWGIAVMMAPTVGPTISGVVIEYLSWRYLFIVNIPVALVALYLAHRLLPETPGVKGGAFDKWGFATVTTGTFSLLYALNQGNTRGWTSPMILFLLGASVVLLYLFWRIESR